MFLKVNSEKTGFAIDLYDSGRRCLYAAFFVSVKSHCIERYIFENIQLTPLTFQYWCRYVSNLSLLWLKKHANEGFFIDEDFEFK